MDRVSKNVSLMLRGSGDMAPTLHTAPASFVLRMRPTPTFVAQERTLVCL